MPEMTTRMAELLREACTCDRTDDAPHEAATCEGMAMHSRVRGFMALRGVANESTSPVRPRDLAVVRDLVWKEFRMEREAMGLTWAGYKPPVIALDIPGVIWEEGAPEEWALTGVAKSVEYFLEMRGLFAEAVNHVILGIYTV